MRGQGGRRGGLSKPLLRRALQAGHRQGLLVVAAACAEPVLWEAGQGCQDTSASSPEVTLPVASLGEGSVPCQVGLGGQRPLLLAIPAGRFKSKLEGDAGGLLSDF